MSQTPDESACRVLVVEDNAAIRYSLGFLLEAWGFEVEQAADGPEGVRKALAFQPHVAVVDIGLPGFDGYEVARRLRKAQGRDIILIALTAHCQPEDRWRAFEAGFCHHVTKPTEPQQLGPLLEADNPWGGASAR